VIDDLEPGLPFRKIHGRDVDHGLELQVDMVAQEIHQRHQVLRRGIDRGLLIQEIALRRALDSHRDEFRDCLDEIVCQLRLRELEIVLMMHMRLVAGLPRVSISHAPVMEHLGR